MTTMYQSLYLKAIYYDFNTCFNMLYSYTIMHLCVITLRFCVVYRHFYTD